MNVEIIGRRLNPCGPPNRLAWRVLGNFDAADLLEIASGVLNADKRTALMTVQTDLTFAKLIGRALIFNTGIFENQLNSHD